MGKQTIKDVLKADFQFDEDILEVLASLGGVAKLKKKYDRVVLESDLYHEYPMDLVGYRVETDEDVKERIRVDRKNTQDRRKNKKARDIQQLKDLAAKYPDALKE